MQLTVASLQNTYWKIPFQVVLALTKEIVLIGAMGPGTWHAKAHLEALRFVMQAHALKDDEPLDYDAAKKCHFHSVTGHLVTEKVYKYLVEMREGLLKHVRQATCRTAMLFDVTVEEGSDINSIQDIIDEISGKQY